MQVDGKLKIFKKVTGWCPEKKPSYKILLVDDDLDVHHVTHFAIDSMNYNDFEVEVIHAYSAREAKEAIHKNPDAALAFIDVVMEKPEAGLKLVNYIRKDIENNLIRLIIRTGQANQYRPMDVIQKYDINGFKVKTDMSIDRLFSTIRSSVKQYEQLIELQNKYDDMCQYMTTNPLTKLSNRMKLNEDIDNNSYHDSLVLIDINGFSYINEHYGYDVGDYVLKTVANFLSSFKDVFNVYHLGNDLFSLLAKENWNEHVYAVIARIEKELSILPIFTSNLDLNISVSLGVARGNNSNLMKKAELALKEIKVYGVTAIQYYTDKLKIIGHIKKVNYWGPIIKEALANDNMIPYYQGIYNYRTQEIERYEALVRLRHEGNIYSPYEFLDVAEHTGQLYSIFKLMFSKACEKAAQTGKSFSINIGSGELSNDDLVSFVASTIGDYKVDPKLLALEILEHNSISDEEKAQDAIYKIHDIGISLIIDDFGVNCSNFGKIGALPIAVLKIDGSFIKNLPHSRNSQVIVKTIKTFAEEQGISLVAEFVSDQSISQTVEALGIEFAQGYYYCEPEAEIN